MTTKIMALVDALGNLIRFKLMPGNRHDIKGVPPLIDGLHFGTFLADKAFDANWLIGVLHTQDTEVVISQHPNRKNPLDIDKEKYKWRHLVESFFCKLEEFKRIAMRADKTDSSYEAMIQICSAVIATR